MIDGAWSCFFYGKTYMILTYGDSKRGLVRKANEDAISMKVDHLFLLADGMGGDTTADRWRVPWLWKAGDAIFPPFLRRRLFPRRG